MNNDSLEKKTRLVDDAIIPERQTEGSAGYDLTHYIDCSIAPSTSLFIDTGLPFTVPFGTFGKIAPCSGFSCKRTIVGAGIIDRDYHVFKTFRNVSIF